MSDFVPHRAALYRVAPSRRPRLARLRRGLRALRRAAWRVVFGLDQILLLAYEAFLAFWDESDVERFRRNPVFRVTCLVWFVASVLVFDAWLRRRQLDWRLAYLAVQFFRVAGLVGAVGEAEAATPLEHPLEAEMRAERLSELDREESDGVEWRRSIRG